MKNKTITVKVEIPVGYNLVINGTDCKLVPESKSRLPKTWEEFCETHPVKNGEAYISADSSILMGDGIRFVNAGRNYLPNKEIAEAFLALMQLIQLRDLYNGDWKPDWKNEHEKKYVILVCRDKVETYRTETANKVLAFKTEKLRDQFFNNFRYLIEIAKPLI